MDAIDQQLREALCRRDSSFPIQFESLVQQVLSDEGSDGIGRLLALFDDRFEFDEVLFSIVHGIESFDDAIYVRALLRDVEPMFQRSPGWATTLHIRMLNSPSCASVYAAELPRLSIAERIIVRHLLHRVRTRNTLLDRLCDQLLTELERPPVGQ